MFKQEHIKVVYLTKVNEILMHGTNETMPSLEKLAEIIWLHKEQLLIKANLNRNDQTLTLTFFKEV